ECSAAVRLSGGDRPPGPGSGTAGHAPGDPGAGPAGASSADCPGAGANHHQGPIVSRSGADLRPGAGVVCAGRRDTPALSDAARFMAVLSLPRGIADGAGAGGTVARAGAAGGRTNAPLGGA